MSNMIPSWNSSMRGWTISARSGVWPWPRTKTRRLSRFSTSRLLACVRRSDTTRRPCPSRLRRLSKPNAPPKPCAANRRRPQNWSASWQPPEISSMIYIAANAKPSVNSTSPDLPPRCRFSSALPMLRHTVRLAIRLKLCVRRWRPSCANL